MRLKIRSKKDTQRTSTLPAGIWGSLSLIARQSFAGRVGRRAAGGDGGCDGERRGVTATWQLRGDSCRPPPIGRRRIARRMNISELMIGERNTDRHPHALGAYSKSKKSLDAPEDSFPKIAGSPFTNDASSPGTSSPGVAPPAQGPTQDTSRDFHDYPHRSDPNRNRSTSNTAMSPEDSRPMYASNEDASLDNRKPVSRTALRPADASSIHRSPLPARRESASEYPRPGWENAPPSSAPSPRQRRPPTTEARAALSPTAANNGTRSGRLYDERGRPVNPPDRPAAPGEGPGLAGDGSGARPEEPAGARRAPYPGDYDQLDNRGPPFEERNAPYPDDVTRPRAYRDDRYADERDERYPEDREDRFADDRLYYRDYRRDRYGRADDDHAYPFRGSRYDPREYDAYDREYYRLQRRRDYEPGGRYEYDDDYDYRGRRSDRDDPRVARDDPRAPVRDEARPPLREGEEPPREGEPHSDARDDAHRGDERLAAAGEKGKTRVPFARDDPRGLHDEVVDEGGRLVPVREDITPVKAEGTVRDPPLRDELRVPRDSSMPGPHDDGRPPMRDTPHSEYVYAPRLRSSVSTHIPPPRPPSRTPSPSLAAGGTPPPMAGRNMPTIAPNANKDVVMSPPEGAPHGRTPGGMLRDVRSHSPMPRGAPLSGRGRSPVPGMRPRSPAPGLRPRSPPMVRGRSPPLMRPRSPGGVRDRSPPPMMRGRSPRPMIHDRSMSPNRMMVDSPPILSGESPPPRRLHMDSPPRRLRSPPRMPPDSPSRRARDLSPLPMDVDPRAYASRPVLYPGPPRDVTRRDAPMTLPPRSHVSLPLRRMRSRSPGSPRRSPRLAAPRSRSPARRPRRSRSPPMMRRPHLPYPPPYDYYAYRDREYRPEYYPYDYRPEYAFRPPPVPGPFVPPDPAYAVYRPMPPPVVAPPPMAGQAVGGHEVIGPQVPMVFAGKKGLACLFCRKRKIACGRPMDGSGDMTCNQCSRRNAECIYPEMSYRGRKKNPNYDSPAPTNGIPASQMGISASQMGQQQPIAAAAQSGVLSTQPGMAPPPGMSAGPPPAGMLQPQGPVPGQPSIMIPSHPPNGMPGQPPIMPAQPSSLQPPQMPPQNMVQAPAPPPPATQSPSNGLPPAPPQAGMMQVPQPQPATTPPNPNPAPSAAT
ncbi:hypothetical protein FISHEDRAFT_56633 [Fistulina hepatica ATCC 64428]|uniref:Zn(2)-C6 fungal-type domain-containing protein n=1 Tax=Fistulina hepatica ATCC 64428 TaxID=1128425 RepID=A0A0D7AJK7_9AGAR|nr:hypothetical protein FISHEDRAFT_56633 [Fistulina hepatica ATCC 64428]